MASPELTVPHLRSVQASLAILKADIASLARSWVLRGWIAALVLAEFFLIATSIVGARGVRIPASNIIATNLGGFLLVWSTLIIVMSAGSVSLEADIISDSILSRACTRVQFIIAKLLARSAFILGVYLVAACSVAYAAYRYASPDVTIGTMALGITVVGLAILLLVALGVLFSVVFNNTLVSVVALLLLWYVASPLFTFFGAEYLSPASLARNLPSILKDPNAPQVLQCTATETSINVLFSKDLDPESAEAVGNYEVECPPGTPVTPQAATYERTKYSVLVTGLTLPKGSKVRVRVRGVTDAGGTPVSEAANAGDCTVPGASESAKESNSRTGRDTTRPRLVRVTGTTSSLRLAFSEELDRKTAEDADHYRVENPIGEVQPVRSATYSEGTRTVLLSGLRLDLNVPVKVTVRNVTDMAGNSIRPGSNSMTFTEVTPWRYALGFGIPALLAALLAVLWFNRRDL